MEGRDGHILLGIVLLTLGLWHLYNHIKLSLTLKSYTSFTWFPTPFLRYFELYFMLLASSIFIISGLYYTLISSNILAFDNFHHLEHSAMGFPFFLHAFFSIFLDKARPKRKAHIDLAHFLFAMCFVQELFVFHFHSTDHLGLEAQYHILLERIIFVCIIFSLLNIWLPKSFMVCYIKSLSLIFQGVWIIIMGIMLWVPYFTPKGCLMKKDDFGRTSMIATCHDQEALDRVKGLIIIMFSWILIGVIIFGVGLYLIVSKVCGACEIMEDNDGEEMICNKKRLSNKYRLIPIDLEQ